MMTLPEMTLPEMIADYAHYRKVCGMKDLVPHSRVHQLVYNARKLYGTDELRQELVDWWWQKRDTETQHSYMCRITDTLPFLYYVVENGMAKITIPPFKARFRFEAPKKVHIMTREEIELFFKACYELPAPKDLRRARALDTLLRNAEVPLSFLLQRALGLRPNESRLLHRSDIDWETGEIMIRETKGYIQHRVFAPEGLLEEMKRVDEVIDGLMPDREYMFPNAKGEPRSADYISYIFRKCWDRYNDSRDAVSYGFRHLYAIENIYSWKPEDNINAKLLALSKSMGHSSIAQTCYYFDLLPPSVAERLSIVLDFKDPVQMGAENDGGYGDGD